MTVGKGVNMVEYTIVQPNYKLELPNFFENQYFNNVTKLDEYSYPTMMNDSLYDDVVSNSSVQDNTPQSSGTSSQLLSAIQKHLGETYSNGKRLQKGYSDCSGFVNKVYKELGIDLGGATSMTMWNKYVDHIDFDQVQPGDLVFLTPKKSHSVAGTYRRAGVDASHVGIVVEKQGTKVKVAENTGYKKKSDYTWYELGGANQPRGENIVNYSKGLSGGPRNELFGFGRIKI